MHGQDSRNEGQGLITVSSGHPSLYKRTVSDVSQCGLCACGWSDLSPSGE